MLNVRFYLIITFHSLLSKKCFFYKQTAIIIINMHKVTEISKLTEKPIAKKAKIVYT